MICTKSWYHLNFTIVHKVHLQIRKRESNKEFVVWCYVYYIYIYLFELGYNVFKKGQTEGYTFDCHNIATRQICLFS